jgi:hypothetical protein
VGGGECVRKDGRREATDFNSPTAGPSLGMERERERGRGGAREERMSAGITITVRR